MAEDLISKKKVNIKTFIVIISILFICILCVMMILNLKNKKAFEDKKKEVTENPFKVYENGSKAEFEDFLEYCEWKKEDIDITVFEFEQNKKYTDRYYVDDKEVMDKFFNLLENVEYVGASYHAEDERKDLIWSVQLINKEAEYSIVIKGYSTSNENINIISFDARYAHYYTSGKISFPNFGFVGDCCIDYNPKVYDGISSIFDEYVKEVTIDEIKEIKAENSKEFDDYFKKLHFFMKTGGIYDAEKKYDILTHIYKFPILDSDCYMEVERYNENGGVYESEYTRVNIERVHIVNENGEKLDLFSCTDEELDAFMK